MANKKAIYGLLDPRTGDIKYVGASSDPARRYMQHLKGNSPATIEWINNLASEGIRPDFRILHDYTDNWQELEYKAINSNDESLLNVFKNNSPIKEVTPKEKTDVSEALATTLRSLREKQGFSQGQVSRSIEVSQPTIARWENGSRTPTVSNLYAVSTAYNTTPYKILEETDNLSIAIEKGKGILNGNSHESKK